MPWLSLILCEVSSSNFESIFIRKFRNLFRIFKNYEGTKYQTIVDKQIFHFSLDKKIIVKNNDFAAQKMADFKDTVKPLMQTNALFPF